MEDDLADGSKLNHAAEHTHVIRNRGASDRHLCSCSAIGWLTVGDARGVGKGSPLCSPC